MAATVEGFRFVKRKWQGRNDPPENAAPDPTVPRTTVYWRWESSGPDGDGIGPVWADTYEGKNTTAVSSDSGRSRPDALKRSPTHVSTGSRSSPTSNGAVPAAAAKIDMQQADLRAVALSDSLVSLLAR